MSIVKSKIRRKKYTEQNYQDIKSDIVDLITQQMSSREKFSKKFNRTKVSTENLLYYLDLCKKAKERGRFKWSQLLTIEGNKAFVRVKPS